MRPDASSLVVYGMATLALAVALVAALAWSRAGASSAGRARRFVVALAAVATWMAVTALAARSGLLAEFDRRPPPMMFLVAGTAVVGLATGLSRVGAQLAERLSFATLIGIQSFRVPLEQIKQNPADESMMPPPM
jgi:hypothetical protein